MLFLLFVREGNTFLDGRCSYYWKIHLYEFSEGLYSIDLLRLLQEDFIDNDRNSNACLYSIDLLRLLQGGGPYFPS
ncbi:hypothetical protein SAMN02745171_01129 [Porphyromonas circumdentaria]|uniref:Uncharacterized protein n=1 Tax=Porphyromonas circumdentaria TaxID=29524 RepID=A0A1T4NJ00_9PORP|nr:hypothetical protein [Porphyromonas circumdentaria]SJZ79095.1 hypothetical protein SAMN02745171_01129 [Porphyromonas circumdentaria]